MVRKDVHWTNAEEEEGLERENREEETRTCREENRAAKHVSYDNPDNWRNDKRWESEFRLTGDVSQKKAGSRYQDQNKERRWIDGDLQPLPLTKTPASRHQSFPKLPIQRSGFMGFRAKSSIVTSLTNDQWQHFRKNFVAAVFVFSLVKKKKIIIVSTIQLNLIHN